MTTQGNEREIPRPRPRPTPGHLVLLLLAVECLLWLSERFQWFAFNQHKGWTVLIAVACVGVAMLVMLAWWAVALIIGWRFQFSIRSLLVLPVAVALPCSWLAVEMRNEEGVRDVNSRAWKSGGAVIADDSGTGLPVWLRNLLGKELFEDIGGVTYNGRPLTDKELAILEDLPRLDVLLLAGTQITDAGLEHLESQPHLSWLFLSDTKATDAGIKHLAGLSELQYLALDGTKVSDAGLGDLAPLTQLKELYLQRTDVTNAGVAKLQRALPNCQITR